jgi:small Trp-rich protein
MYMYFIGLGVLLLILRIAEYGPVGQWPWWVVLLPFGAAVLWWAWADGTGYTKRKEVEKMDGRVAKRREENLAALGLNARGRRQKKRR